MEKKDFLALVEDFMSRTGMKPTRFSILAVNEPDYVRKLRGGRESREAVRNRVLDFIGNYSEKSKEKESDPKKNPANI